MSALTSSAPDQLTTLFVDMNSFFTSVEQNENPMLRGKPVVVVPMMADATCAIAASYEAKAYGIKTGTKIYDAKRLCPHLTCVLARHDIYVDYHHRILAAADKHIPVRKVWSIDEFDCALMGREKDLDIAKKIAANIKAQILSDVGPALRCSVGIAPNSFLAKVASDMKKPDGLTVLHPEHLPHALLHLKLTDLPGINVNMESRLHHGGIKTVSDLWHTSPKHARALWGSVQGERFWYWLHGYDIPYQNTTPSMVGHSRVLGPDLRTPEKARSMARRLLYKAVLRLRRTDYCATKLSFSVRFLDGRKWVDERTFPAARDAFTFLLHFDALWDDMCLRVFGCKRTQMPTRLLCKKVSIVLHGLKEQNMVTDDLFQTRFQAQKTQNRKWESLSSALEKLNDKYHKETVSIGTPPKTLAGHVGTKIAFSRVPSKDEFLE